MNDENDECKKSKEGGEANRNPREDRQTDR